MTRTQRILEGVTRVLGGPGSGVRGHTTQHPLDQRENESIEGHVDRVRASALHQGTQAGLDDDTADAAAGHTAAHLQDVHRDAAREIPGDKRAARARPLLAGKEIQSHIERTIMEHAMP